MASKPNPNDLPPLPEVRALAQKLFGQCRDSHSSYRLLTSSCRKLRNVLEECEEVFDETRTLGPDGWKLLAKVAQSRSILGRLDLALQSYRCSKHKDVNESTVADFKTVLDVTTEELATAFEGLTTGEIELRLDTATDYDVIAGASKSHSSESAHDRKSSRTSSAWSLVPRDSTTQDSSPDTANLPIEPQTGEHFSDEKQVFAAEDTHIQTTAATEPRASMDWNSPFGPDPMSIDIVKASSMILSGDDDLGMSATRSRAGTGETVYVDAVSPRVGGGSEGEEEGVGVGAGGAGSAVGAVKDKGQEVRLTSGLGGLIRSSSVARKRTSGGIAKLRMAGNEGQDFNNTLRRLSDARDDGSHLSPKTAEREFQPRERPSSVASTTGSFKSARLSLETDERGKRPESVAMAGTIRPLSPKRNSTASEQADTKAVVDHHAAEARTDGSDDVLYNELNTMLQRALSPSEEQAIAKPLPQALVSQDELSLPTRSQDMPPPPPTRRPPPPPPKPRRKLQSRSDSVVSTKHTAANDTSQVQLPISRFSALGSTSKSAPENSESKFALEPEADTRPRTPSYRIVNATPPPESSSDDEDLYSSSRPASAFIPERPDCPRSQDVARLSVDGSAYEEAEKGYLGSDGMQKSDEDVPSSGTRTEPASHSSTATVLADGIELTQNDDKEAVTVVSDPHIAGQTCETAQSSPEQQQPPPLPERPPPTDPPPSSSQETPRSPPPPPPVPRRPTQARYRAKRPIPSETHSSPAAISHEDDKAAFEKETAPEAGLEVGSRLRVDSKAGQLRECVSVDAALGVLSAESSVKSNGAMGADSRQPRSASTPQMSAEASASREPPASLALRGWYAPENNVTTNSILDAERIGHIVHFWNAQQWDQAEAYLKGFLETLLERDDLARARRIRHLLGVCASFKGQWEKAISLFLSVLRAPIRDIGEIDDGDCAAAYWLGDAYSLFNRRTEALLAYCVAERCSFFNDPSDPELCQLIAAEKQVVLLGNKMADHKLLWAQEALRDHKSPIGSILDTKVIEKGVAKCLLENEPPEGPEKDSPLHAERSRCISLYKLSKNPGILSFKRMKLSPGHFQPDTEWPLLYDPFFCMANVKPGRLFKFEGDLLEFFTRNTDTKLPKSGPLGLSRMECITSSDLAWLITSIRDCLKMLEMEFSEVVNKDGTWFLARYSFMQEKENIATTYYFSIALFRQSLRSGYGAEICPGGICSARIINSGIEWEKGVHTAETKRVRRLIRENLEEAAKQRPRLRKNASATVLRRDSGNAPPVPPRPSG